MTSIIRTITAAVAISALFLGSFAAGYAVAYQHGWDDAYDDRFTPGNALPSACGHSAWRGCGEDARRGRSSLPLPFGRLVDLAKLKAEVCGESLHGR